ncbi:MAG: exodeoxyribonuclease VII small subunit [Bacteroidales bacterium]|nr:exodeoxyribonuclease VII small subunit [Bacteroidales bacterium]
MEEKFDYAKAMATLEKMAADAQNPETPVEDIGKMVRESKTLVKDCREYLRSLRDTIEEQ